MYVTSCRLAYSNVAHSTTSPQTRFRKAPGREKRYWSHKIMTLYSDLAQHTVHSFSHHSKCLHVCGYPSALPNATLSPPPIKTLSLSSDDITEHFATRVRGTSERVSCGMTNPIAHDTIKQHNYNNCASIKITGNMFCKTPHLCLWPKEVVARIVDGVNPYPTAFPYGNGMVLHFYQQQESSTTKTVHNVINKGLKTYV